MDTVLEILRKTEAWFAGKGVPRPRLDAEHLVAHALGCRRLDLYLRHDMPMEEPVLERLRALARRRAQREPLQHILGEWDFFNLRLKLDARALIPRQETEQLVEEVAAHFRNGPPHHILDLGTGSGAIILALLKHWPQAQGTAVDRSADALALARENADEHAVGGRVRFVQGCWMEPLEEGVVFDLIISNPPYLTEEEWSAAEPEVREHDPRGALVAAEAGLADLHRILDEAAGRLEPGGWIYLETGIDQHESLMDRARECGLQEASSLKDYSGRPRFFRARRGGASISAMA